MKHLFIIVSLLLSFLLKAQEGGSIKGKILDAEQYNEPLLMANVVLKGTTWSTWTNFNGNFEIVDIIPGEYVLKVSFLGYEDLEFPIVVRNNGNTQINRRLQAKNISLTDVAETNLVSTKNGTQPSGLK
ncbi:carboxypeptidase-like regulatory domain-containing protein [Maribacter chungangensis]|uniref:Carboxypeptidase-like regulatory domain-containing protein n=1 Tax=Maribacter chungangensis TaxID=1069117 RepID=A0ABW3AYH5_9FLAO